MRAPDQTPAPEQHAPALIEDIGEIEPTGVEVLPDIVPIVELPKGLQRPSDNSLGGREAGRPGGLGQMWEANQG